MFYKDLLLSVNWNGNGFYVEKGCLMSEFSEIWEKTNVKTLKVQMPRKIFDMLERLLASPPETFSHNYVCQDRHARRKKENFVMCAIIQKYVDNHGLDYVEKNCFKLSDYGFEMEGGRVACIKGVDPKAQGNLSVPNGTRQP
jgi:hypothetical protein